MASRPSLSTLGLILIAITVGATLPPVALADASDYEISIPDSIDIPDRTVTIEGTDYPVTALGQEVPGEQLSVNVTAPEGREYKLYLYNGDVQIEAARSMNGSGDATFETDSLEPGSYFVATYRNGEIQAIHPVVLAGYDVTIDAPDGADPGEHVTVDIDIQALNETEPVNRVEVAAGNETEALRMVAEREGPGSYRANVSVDLPPGTYVIYGVVRGHDEVEGGREELLGASPGDAFQVGSTTSQDADDTDTPSDDSDTDGGGGGGSGSFGAVSTPTATDTPAETATTASSSTSSATQSATHSPTGTSILTPNPTSTATPTPTGPPTGQPGFGALVALIVVLALLTATGRRG